MKMKIHSEKKINEAYDIHSGMEYCYFCMRERLDRDQCCGQSSWLKFRDLSADSRYSIAIDYLNRREVGNE
jgi:hypothetical protein